MKLKINVQEQAALLWTIDNALVQADVMKPSYSQPLIKVYYKLLKLEENQ